MDIQRLRTLTTGRLHTEMDHVYQDIETITGIPGVFTHQIPNIMRAMTPYLKAVVTDPRFWDGEFDQSHVGEYDVPPMPKDEQETTLKRFGELPSPLEGKEVIVVQVGDGS